MCGQLERAPSSGREHLQAYVVFPVQRTLAALRQACEGHAPHFEAARGTHQECIRYCSKEETRLGGPWFWGETPSDGGADNGTAQAARRVAALAPDHSFTDLLTHEETASYCAKYMRAAEMVYHAARAAARPRFDPLASLHPWETTVLRHLNAPPSDRHLLWIFEEQGRAGKSTFARHLTTLFRTVVFDGAGHLPDLMYIWFQQHEKAQLVIVDFPRSCLISQPYVTFLETLKNLHGTSTKYQSRPFSWHHIHVLVFANSPCPRGSFSADRLASTHWRIDPSTLDGLVLVNY